MDLLVSYERVLVTRDARRRFLRFADLQTRQIAMLAYFSLIRALALTLTVLIAS